jgi:cbb3-type cytochrome oxidase maturation protein
MTVLALLIPVSLFLGLVGLCAFIWALRSRQYEDLEGDAARILFEEPDKPRD